MGIDVDELDAEAAAVSMGEEMFDVDGSRDACIKRGEVDLEEAPELDDIIMDPSGKTNRDGCPFIEAAIIVSCSQPTTTPLVRQFSPNSQGQVNEFGSIRKVK